MGGAGVLVAERVAVQLAVCAALFGAAAALAGTRAEPGQGWAPRLRRLAALQPTVRFEKLQESVGESPHGTKPLEEEDKVEAGELPAQPTTMGRAAASLLEEQVRRQRSVSDPVAPTSSTIEEKSGSPESETRPRHGSDASQEDLR